ncbi:type II toxin-antitoxin system MqsR family toxin [Flexilinea flocculi]|uniref:Toxin n=1 Tax=Flexilinea flocculi TaxID=1678840 RepID=A0A0S7BQP4_9CHLR|nr:type II toxin-antitoxin system MqsR family toxin [Flexilinea flocculi]GAP40098.1 hypothetical protein ATC1_1363 [Flexilinea flocculi]
MEGFSEEELRRQILIFLKDFKELMGQGYYFVKEHHKNVQTLKNLGITSRIRDEIILSVAMEDYSSGPNPDEYHPGYYWIFGKNIDSNEIYIKLKIVTYNNGNDRAVCYSFHLSEYPLNYPLRR